MEKYEGSRILIVDDSRTNVFMLKGILEAEGYEVFTAQNGVAALKILKNTIPDAILLDVMMPGISGLELLENIRQDKNLDHVPVIMVTAKIEAEDIKIALDKGAVDYICKPVNDVELLARLRTALRIKHYEDSLKHLVKLKNQFVSIISHDLRSPFTSIIGFAQLLLNDANLHDKNREFVQRIFNVAIRQLDYIEKLLNMTHLESGKFQLRIKNLNLKKLVDESLLIFDSKIQQKNISIKVDIQDKINIKADETLFSQVLNNLISNAIKYTHPQGAIFIIAEKKDKHITVLIKDTGVGISPDDITKVFDEFNHHYSIGTKGEQGAGLGLSICKKILDAHNFNIILNSTVNVGTEFKIIIPEQV